VERTAAGYSDPVANVAQPVSYYEQRRYIEGELFSSLVRGLRIQVKDGEEPSSTAARLIAIHSELMIKAEQVGIIEPRPSQPADAELAE
jgi:hypothetical protein